MPQIEGQAQKKGACLVPFRQENPSLLPTSGGSCASSVEQISPRWWAKTRSQCWSTVPLVTGCTIGDRWSTLPGQVTRAGTTRHEVDPILGTLLKSTWPLILWTMMDDSDAVCKPILGVAPSMRTTNCPIARLARIPSAVTPAMGEAGYRGFYTLECGPLHVVSGTQSSSIGDALHAYHGVYEVVTDAGSIEPTKTQTSNQRKLEPPIIMGYAERLAKDEAR